MWCLLVRAPFAFSLFFTFCFFFTLSARPPACLPAARLARISHFLFSLYIYLPPSYYSCVGSRHLLSFRTHGCGKWWAVVGAWRLSDAVAWCTTDRLDRQYRHAGGAQPQMRDPLNIRGPPLTPPPPYACDSTITTLTNKHTHIEYYPPPPHKSPLDTKLSLKYHLAAITMIHAQKYPF